MAIFNNVFLTVLRCTLYTSFREAHIFMNSKEEFALSLYENIIKLYRKIELAATRCSEASFNFLVQMLNLGFRVYFE